MKKRWTIRLLLQPSCSQRRRRLSAYVRAHGGHFEHILCVKLMSIIFEFGVLLFLPPKYRPNLSETFSRYGYYAGQVTRLVMQVRWKTQA